MTVDPRFMIRALNLARNGKGNVSPNPMVGAVIVDSSGRIIGEGYHRQYGHAHAEVNAIRSVQNRELLKNSTIYVTLEPCSHYGKTPPCAQLIIDMQIPRVVVGAGDPNIKVCGRGIAMLRSAGIEVVEGVMADESIRLNARFMTAHRCRRPFVTLKWAQSSDGYIDHRRTSESPHAAVFSTNLSSMDVHRLRSLHDAILVGSSTVLADDPLLDSRLWGGRFPQPVILDRRHRVDDSFNVMSRNPIVVDRETAPNNVLKTLFSQGITSLLVEGGAKVLNSFIDSGLWDVARVETSTIVLGDTGSVRAPSFVASPAMTFDVDFNRVDLYSNNPLVDVKNL